jgi:ABC-type transporter Mla MlaB component
MSDSFCGSLTFGGTVTEEQLSRLNEFVTDVSTSDEIDDAGVCYFDEATLSDFVELIEHCESNKIALMIQWDAKYEFDGRVEYYVAGNRRDYVGSQGGNIMCFLYELEDAVEKNPGITVHEFIKGLDVPNFPLFALQGETV